MYEPTAAEDADARRKLRAILRGRPSADDEIQDALLVAVQKYDPTRGVAFPAFAAGVGQKMRLRPSQDPRLEYTNDEATLHAQGCVDVGGEGQVDATRALGELSAATLAGFAAEQRAARIAGRRHHDSNTLFGAVIEFAKAEHDAKWGHGFDVLGAFARWNDEDWSVEQRARGIWKDLRKALRREDLTVVRRELRRVVEFSRTHEDCTGARVATYLAATIGPAVGPVVEDMAALAANLGRLRSGIAALAAKVPRDPRKDLLRPPSLDRWLEEWDGSFPYEAPSTDRDMALVSILAGIFPEVKEARYAAGVTVAEIVEAQADAVAKARVRLRRGRG